MGCQIWEVLLMSDERLVINKITKVIKEPIARYPRIRVDRDTYIEVVRLATETNRTINDIVSEMLEFALKHTEIGEEIFIES